MTRNTYLFLFPSDAFSYAEKERGVGAAGVCRKSRDAEPTDPDGHTPQKWRDGTGIMAGLDSH